MLDETKPIHNHIDSKIMDFSADKSFAKNLGLNICG